MGWLTAVFLLGRLVGVGEGQESTVLRTVFLALYFDCFIILLQKNLFTVRKNVVKLSFLLWLDHVFKYFVQFYYIV